MANFRTPRRELVEQRTSKRGALGPPGRWKRDGAKRQPSPNILEAQTRRPSWKIKRFRKSAA
eukprot:15438471-Alexandrium_andersonii.AAC.1